MKSEAPSSGQITPPVIDTPCFLTDKGGVVLWANPSAYKVLGVGTAEAIKGITGLTAAELSRLLDTKMPSTFTISTGGSSRTLLATPVSSGDEDLIFCLLLSGLWIPTDKRSELLASVAHDLKNPMGAIFGYADALLDTSIGEGMSDNQRSIVERIRMTSARAVELVRNYQQLARMEAEPRKEDIPTADLIQVVKDVIDMTWRDSDATLKLILEKDPIKVKLGKIELERSIANLLTNAQKFTPKDGSVTIKTWKGSKEAHISITNSGSIIPSSEYGVIFERYGRGSGAKEISGTGLGLFIVREILSRRGGKVHVVSSEDNGTTFTLDLPIAE